MIKIITPDIYEKDAIGNFCLDFYSLLTKKGLRVELYARHYLEENKEIINHMDLFFDRISKDDIIFYNYSIYDINLEEIIILPNKKICYFHGVTPYELLLEFEPITAELCKKSIGQFTLLEKFDVVMANSIFSAEYLQSFISKKNIRVYPPLFKTRQFTLQNNLNLEKNGNFLVIGRIVPHKKIEDAILLFNKLLKKFESSKLYIIGIGHNELYNSMLLELVKQLKLEEKVFFLGKINDKKLRKYYMECFSLINASLHEGFGIPVLEGLFNGLIPIIRENNAMVEIAGENCLTFSDIENCNIDKFESLLKKDKFEFYKNAQKYLDYSDKLLEYIIKLENNND